MPLMDKVNIGVGDIGLLDPDGRTVRLASLPPIQLIVLIRHHY